MNLYPKFADALALPEFLKQYGSDTDRSRWSKVHDEVHLSDEQRALLGKFTRETHVLVLAGAWCGDCVRQCPIFSHFAEAAPALKVRYLDRDDHADAQTELLVNGGKRVPVVVFFSEDGHEVARFGDRTLAAYRAMMEQHTGASCASGVVSRGDPLLKQATQDWLDQFERVQWILRLSPRLRQKHGD
ncbi:MAG: thioredoxin family protein [Gemmataceae bacterium]|nr:thioredoxin family protein [Gemmataceae bacterium]